MPILTINLQREAYGREQLDRLLVGASELYARVLESPLERVRVFINLLDPGALAVGGRIVAESGARAPFFEAIVMAGRPEAQKQRLMQEVTDLIDNTRKQIEETGQGLESMLLMSLIGAVFLLGLANACKLLEREKSEERVSAVAEATGH